VEGTVTIPNFSFGEQKIDDKKIQCRDLDGINLNEIGKLQRQTSAVNLNIRINTPRKNDD
jgi:hypothetical protein